jgi:hypothetical protein
MNRYCTALSTFALAVGLTFAVAAIAADTASKAPAPVSVEDSVSIAATVEAIDHTKRLVTLRGPEGRTATIEVPPDVRNLAQVKVGDKLVVRYHESLAAAVKPKGTSTTLKSVDQTVGAGRAEPGAKPGAAVGTASTMTVVIQSVDKTLHTVTFAGGDGIVRVTTVKDPEAKKFIEKLKKGDEVELTYKEALAVSVEAAK